MLNHGLHEELMAMRAEDLRVRQELVDSGELGGSYVPRMEAVHIRNAERLTDRQRMWLAGQANSRRGWREGSALISEATIWRLRPPQPTTY
jgi:hypothetical protein